MYPYQRIPMGNTYISPIMVGIYGTPKLSQPVPPTLRSTPVAVMCTRYAPVSSLSWRHFVRSWARCVARRGEVEVWPNRWRFDPAGGGLTGGFLWYLFYICDIHPGKIHNYMEPKALEVWFRRFSFSSFGDFQVSCFSFWVCVQDSCGISVDS